MAFICYRSNFHSCKHCEHFRYDEDSGRKACFAKQEASLEESCFNYLEGLRRSYVVSKYGATSYLMSEFHLSKQESEKILKRWMEEYESLSKKYGWNEEIEK